MIRFTQIQCLANSKLVHEPKLLVRVRVWGWVRVMVDFGTSAFRRWVRVPVKVLGGGLGVRARKFKSGDCALAINLVSSKSPPASP